MKCALIENGIVTNTIVLSLHNLKEFPNAIPIERKPVGIGDKYNDDKFWRDGKEILTIEQSLNNSIIRSQQQLTDLDISYIEAQQKITEYELKK